MVFKKTGLRVAPFLGVVCADIEWQACASPHSHTDVRNEGLFYIRILFLPSLLLNIPVDRPSFALQETCSCAKFIIKAEGVPNLESEGEERSTFTECPKDSFPSSR